LNDSSCNEPGDTWLFRISGTQLSEDRVLKEARLIDEIQEHDRPVILKWDYSGVPKSAGDLPGGEHYVIITGYNPDTGKFRVYDPWSGADSTSGGNEYWISYAGYLSPKVDMGQEVFAIHSFDVFNLKLGPGKLTVAAKGNPALSVEPPMMQFALQPIDFGELDRARETIQRVMQGRVVYTRDRVRVSEPLSVGEVYPIVVITTKQLMQAHDRPEMLLEPRTSSVIATVVKAASGEIVDSLLLYNDAGTWKEAEYSNTTITRLLGTVRAQHPIHEDNPLHSYYLVSIPEQASFFAARGFGGSALLASLDNDAKGGLISAHEALGGLIQRIEDAARRRATTSRSTAASAQ
jgi:hypothetical protein